MSIVTQLRPRSSVATWVSPPRRGGPKEAGVSPLPLWRLRRTIEYVEANLAAPVRLADMADAAGLSAMHFAAQFRAATGQRPREHLLRRRIARACALLAGSERPLVDVALSVGFQSQAHFSTVFRRFIGDTPWRWRQSTWNEAAHTSWHLESGNAAAEDRPFVNVATLPLSRS